MNIQRKLNLKGKINAALVKDYNKRSVVAHFFNNDMTIPVWAIFETLTLGEFGTLYDCACTNVKVYVSRIMKLPTNLDSDGMNTQFLFYFKRLEMRLHIIMLYLIQDSKQEKQTSDLLLC